MLQRAKDAYIAGVDTLAEYTTVKQHLAAELDRLKSKLPCEEPIDEMQVRENFRRNALNVLDQIEATDDPKTQNDLLKSICEKVVFDRPNNAVELFFYAII